MTEKTPTIKFAPGVLEQLETEMDPEELQSFLNELQEMALNGDIIEHAEVVDMDKLAIEDPELYATLSKQLDGVFESDEEPPTVH